MGADVFAAFQCPEDAFGVASGQRCLVGFGAGRRCDVGGQGEAFAGKNGEAFAFGGGELCAAAVEGDDGVALVQPVSGLEGAHVSGGGAGEDPAFDGDDGGNGLRSGGESIHVQPFCRGFVQARAGPLRDITAAGRISVLD